MKAIVKYTLMVLLLMGSALVMAEVVPCCLELLCCHEQAPCCH
jgi:hypothetical protein